MTSSFETTSAEETYRFGQRLGACLRSGDLVSLEGELGAGKTCLVRGIAHGLGVEPREISSPTFTIVHEHGFDGGTLYHVDAYRLSGAEDLGAIGWEAIGADAGRVVVCEWASRIADGLGEPTVSIEISHRGTDRRSFAVCVSDGAAGRFDAVRVD